MNPIECILVVDPSRVTGEVLAHCLRGPRRNSASVRSIPEARALVKQRSVTLVVLDTALPDAFEWFDEISKCSERPSVVVVTLNPSFEEEVQATLLGAIAYLAKPISPAELARVLDDSRSARRLVPA